MMRSSHFGSYLHVGAVHARCGRRERHAVATGAVILGEMEHNLGSHRRNAPSRKRQRMYGSLAAPSG